MPTSKTMTPCITTITTSASRSAHRVDWWYQSCAMSTSCRSPESNRRLPSSGKKAKDGQLSLDDMTGGTFTISNGGVFGSLLSTPILNPPQSAILGMHKTQERPVVETARSWSAR